MSFLSIPAALKAGAPTVADDSSKGYVVGSRVVDTSVTPRVIYACVDASRFEGSTPRGSSSLGAIYGTGRRTSTTS